MYSAETDDLSQMNTTSVCKASEGSNFPLKTLLYFGQLPQLPPLFKFKVNMNL